MGNIIIIDPTREEENLSDGMYVIGVAGGNVVAIQKVIGAFTKDEINYMINDSINQYLKLKDSIINAMKNPSTELRL